MAAPKLSITEQAIAVSRVRKGETRTAVAKDFGITQQAVSSLCNSRKAATAAEIAMGMMAEETFHALHDIKAKEEFILDTTLEFRKGKEEFNAADLRAMTQNLMDAAKLTGQLVDKQELTGKDGAPLLSGITVTFVDPK